MSPRSEKPLGFEYRVVLSKTPSKNLFGPMIRNCLFSMTIHLSIFLKLYKSLFNLLHFLHLWIQYTFPSANPVFCFSIFYAITASTFLCPQSLFSVPQFLMRSQPPLFLIHEACFLFLSILCDYGGHGSSTIPCPQILFSVPQFFMRLRRLLFLLREACFLFLSFLCDYGLCFSFLESLFCVP